MVLTKDGNHLITIAKTKDKCFEDFKFHMVVHEVTNRYAICCHSIIPQISQRWDHYEAKQRGKVVKVLEYPMLTLAGATT